MARTEKTTRFRGLPPKIQRQLLDSVSGSYPTKFKTAADGRFGYGVAPWDDTWGINYGVTQSLIHAINLPSGTAFNTANDLDINFPSTLGVIKRGMGDTHIQRIEPGLSYIPYNETHELALDGAESSFYRTGSSITDAGYGFQQPLSAKTVITIDLSCPTGTEFGMKSGSNQDYTMVYYNHATKLYQAVGSQNSFDTYASYLGSTYFQEKAVAFGPVGDYVYNHENYMAGSPTDAFGFPNHPKYMVAQSGCYYPMESILTGPFLLEKVVVEFSATIDNYSYAAAFTGSSDFYGNYYLAPTGSNTSIPSLGPAYGTFFVLNARQGKTVDNALATLGSNNFAGPLGASIYLGQAIFSNVDVGSRHTSGSFELVTYMQFGSKSASDPTIEAARTRELMFGESARTGDGYTTGFAVMSGTVKAPGKVTNWSSYILPKNWAVLYYYTANRNGNRNGLPEPVGRNWKGLVGTESLTENTDAATSAIFPKVCLTPSRNNPYILMPKDRLVFGWQSPYIQRFDTDNWYTKNCGIMTLAPGEYKVKLYGSYLELGDDGELREKHDTLNQLLSSNLLSEVIE